MQANGETPSTPKNQTTATTGLENMEKQKRYKLADAKMRLKTIKIRFNESEWEQVTKRQTGKTFAGWLRQVALAHVPIHQADTDLVRNIGRIGSNLNQVAKYANTQKSLDQNVLNEVVAIRLMLKQLIDQNIADAIRENSDDR